jgi:hypothetical protein
VEYSGVAEYSQYSLIKAFYRTFEKKPDIFRVSDGFEMQHLTASPIRAVSLRG